MRIISTTPQPKQFGAFHSEQRMRQTNTTTRHTRLTALLLALLAVSPVTRAAEHYTVCVFTFANLTGSPENDWLAHGFAEALTSKLSAIGRLRLDNRRQLAHISRVRQIDQSALNERNLDAAKSITGSDFLIFGAVQASGGQPEAPVNVLINARVVQVSTGRIIRARQMRGQMSDIFGMQTALARQFTEIFNIERTRIEDLGLEYDGTSSVEAYRYYNEGLQLLDAGEYEKAIAKFDAASTHHPGIIYAEARYALGTAYIESGQQRKLLEVYGKDAAQLSGIFYNLGLASERAGDNHKALAAYTTFVKYALNRPGQADHDPVAPTDLDGYLALARLALTEDRPGDAAAACVYILNHLDHDNRRALRLLLELYRNAGKEDLAVSIEQRLRQTGTENEGTND